MINTLYNIDCEEGMASLESNSVDIISTDPPYIKEEWEHAYTILAEGAARILKPSGWLISYSGHFNLDKVMEIFKSNGLTYYWTTCQLNQGPTAIVHARNVLCGWKPILIYQKPPFTKCKKGFFDVIKSDAEKSLHPWQQAVEDQLWILRRFAEPGQLLVEPFAGSGTAISAAKQVGLKWIAFEKDPETYRVAKARQVQESILDEW
jgi:site-specific DNA-methyltransferase (adenine-specific)